jgi:poly(A) polymerase
VAERTIDYVGGLRDLDARIVRCVDQPEARFREDHLRMLRAVRFSATLQFTIETATRDAIRAQAGMITRISAERVRDELIRTLCESARPGDAVRELDAVGLLEHILPEVRAMKGVEQPPQFHPEGDVFEHTILMLNTMRDPSPTLALAVLLHDVGKPPTAIRHDDRWRFNNHAQVGADIAGRILRRLRLSSANTEAVQACIHGHMRFMDVENMKRSTLRRFVGRPTFTDELELHRLDCVASHGDLANYDSLVRARAEFDAEPVLPPPWISGRDIMDMGVPEGTEVGVWKQKAYDAQLDGHFEGRTELLAWLRETFAEAQSAGGDQRNPN